MQLVATMLAMMTRSECWLKDREDHWLAAAIQKNVWVRVGF